MKMFVSFAKASATTAPRWAFIKLSVFYTGKIPALLVLICLSFNIYLLNLLSILDQVF
jgi:hypothetical protein